jgi:hypothetical protein
MISGTVSESLEATIRLHAIGPTGVEREIAYHLMP